MITITYQNFMAALALFTALCVAVGWLIKIINVVKKPSNTTKEKFEKVDEKLHNDDERIKKLDEDIGYIKQTQTQTLKALLVILDELKKSNDVDGVIQRTEEDMQSFLINNR